MDQLELNAAAPGSETLLGGAPLELGVTLDVAGGCLRFEWQREVRPHWEALMLVAEPAWQASLTVERSHVPQTLEAAFAPRSRRWFV